MCEVYIKNTLEKQTQKQTTTEVQFNLNYTDYIILARSRDLGKK